MSKILLVLGCGHKPVVAPTGWVAVNHDLTAHAKHVTAVHDLNVLPWPWADSSVRQIQAHSVLEHLTITLVASMNECWRIITPRGQIDLKLPLWNVDRSHDDPTHRFLVGLGIYDNFDPTTERGRTYGKLYDIRPWRLLLSQADAGATCVRGILEAVK